MSRAGMPSPNGTSRADPSASASVSRARRAGLLSALDQHFAERICDLFGEQSEEVRFAVALACHQASVGHVCADLGRLVSCGLGREDAVPGEEETILATGQSLAGWLSAIGASEVVARSGDPTDGQPRPLVLDAKGRLYLHRLDRAEGSLAAAIRRRLERPDFALGGFDAPREIARALDEPEIAGRAAGPPPADVAPGRALALGLARPLTILTGGPGTGKTTLVARLILVLAREAIATRGRPPRVLLLAPTGKAAAALAASFVRERGRSGLDDADRAALPTRAETIHRALARAASARRGGRVGGAGFDADVVVVDEASMVDLEQMARIFEACEAVPRLVLLGDPGQLASVEAGAVLADLCGDGEAGAPHPALERSIVRLTRSHRYASSGGIGQLAEAVRAGDADRALAILDDPKRPEVARIELGSGSGSMALLADEVRRLESSVAGELFPEAKLARLADYRVLCAHRRGAFGVESIARLLDLVAARSRQASSRQPAWPGQLLLVTQNAPEQALWNGDVGLVERQDGALRAIFPGEQGGVRSFSLARLPAHESAIAMSVHKSQGSEFARIDLVLSARPTRLMTRELLYTGITRAREGLRIHASEAALRAAIARRARRDSGLGDRLRSGEA